MSTIITDVMRLLFGPRVFAEQESARMEWIFTKHQQSHYRDAEIEDLISRAGRDRVFSRARSMGWTPENSPPKWVWRDICNDIINEKNRCASCTWRQR